jgi:hypothetical protein
MAALESHHYRTIHMGADSYYGGDGYALPQRFGPEAAQSHSTSPRRRSPSPNASRGRRSDSASTKGRSRSTKSRTRHNHADAYADSMNGYSSGDGGAPSTTSARTKEQLGTTDISVENIVEGGRRKRAKFESSVSAAHHHLNVCSLFANFFPLLAGTAIIRTASDAGCHFEPIRLARPSCRTSQTISFLCTNWPEPFYKPTAPSLSAKLQ